MPYRRRPWGPLRSANVPTNQKLLEEDDKENGGGDHKGTEYDITGRPTSTPPQRHRRPPGPATRQVQTTLNPRTPRAVR